MKTDYKKGDIVELLNFEVPDAGRIGYFMNQYGMIPKVGHRYYVHGGSDEFTDLISLVCGTTDQYDIVRNFVVAHHQVCLYKKSNKL